MHIIHIALILTLVGCHSTVAEPDATPPIPTVPSAVAQGTSSYRSPAPARYAAGLRQGELPLVHISWSRAQGLGIRGWPIDKRLTRDIDTRLAALGLGPAQLVPGETSLSHENRRALLEAVIHLTTAEVEIVPSAGLNVPDSEREGLVFLQGLVMSDADRQKMDLALARTRGLRFIVELEDTDPLIDAGYGVLEVGPEPSPRSPGAPPAPATTLRGPSLPFATDETGRVGPGRYELENGTLVQVHAGHRTHVRLDAGTVLVRGRRFHLDAWSKRVVGPTDEGALVLAGGRPRVPAGQPLEPTVARLVISADLSATSAEGHARLVKDKQPVHFLIDFDGTLYQTLDVADVVDGMPLDEIHVALNNTLQLDGPAYPADHPDASRMAEFPRSGPALAHIGGTFRWLYGYSFEQLSTLASLTRRLVEIFPRLGRGFVWDDVRLTTPFALEEDVVKPRDGIMLMSQLDARRHDPGPAFDVRFLLERLAADDEPTTPDTTGHTTAKELVARLYGLSPRTPLFADPAADLVRLIDSPGIEVFTELYPVSPYLARDYFENHVADILPTLVARPGDTILDVRRTTGKDLAQGPVEGFPPELHTMAEQLQPESEWYAWKVGDPAHPELARSGHGLVRASGRFYLIPTPWKP